MGTSTYLNNVIAVNVHALLTNTIIVQKESMLISYKLVSIKIKIHYEKKRETMLTVNAYLTKAVLGSRYVALSQCEGG